MLFVEMLLFLKRLENTSNICCVHVVHQYSRAYRLAHHVICVNVASTDTLKCVIFFTTQHSSCIKSNKFQWYFEFLMHYSINDEQCTFTSNLVSFVKPAILCTIHVQLVCQNHYISGYARVTLRLFVVEIALCVYTSSST